MTAPAPKHPEVHVRMVGEDGNAFAILGRVRRAMRRAGVPQAELDAFTAEATAGDYPHLLATVMAWVDVDGGDSGDRGDDGNRDAMRRERRP